MNALALLLLAASMSAPGVPTLWVEGTLRGFPMVRSMDGRPIADGALTQFIEEGKLHAEGVYDFRDGRQVMRHVWRMGSRGTAGTRCAPQPW